MTFDELMKFIQTPVVSGFVGVVVGGLIGWLSAWHVGASLARRRDFNLAADRFKSSFAYLVNLMELGGSDIPLRSGDLRIKNYFKDNFESTRQNYVEFRSEFRGHKRAKFEAAWQRFSNLVSNLQDEEDMEEIQKKYLSVLKPLLKFAKRK